MKKLILFLVFIVLSIQLVSAVDVFSFWTENNDNEITIQEDSNAEFYVRASAARSFDIRIWLEDEEDDQVHEFLDINYDDGNANGDNVIYVNVFDWNYENSGNYEIHILADDGRASDEVILEIHVEEVDNTPTIELISPNNNARNIILNPFLIWEGEDDGDITYDLYLDNNLILEDTELTQYHLRNLEYITRYEWFVVVSDGEFRVRSETYSFTTMEEEMPNTAPVATIDFPRRNIEVVEGSRVIFNGHGSDVDGDNIRDYQWSVDNMLFGEFSRASYIFHNIGEYDISFRVYDGELWSDYANVGVRVVEDNINENPTIEITSPREESRISNVHRIRWDADDDGEIVSTRIEYERHGLIPLFDLLHRDDLLIELDGNPGSYDWDTTDLENGVYSLTITVTDNEGLESLDTVERFRIINFVVENLAPEITSEPIINAMINRVYRYNVDAIDPNGDEIIYSLVSSPVGMSINREAGIISWIPRNTGIYRVVVRASDRELNDEQEFLINVLGEALLAKEPKEVHKFSISNAILNQDGRFINVYVQVKNKGNQNEEIQLRVVNLNTGDIVIDSFKLDNSDNHWRLLKLPKPISGMHTIVVFGNSKDYKDVIYREIVV